MTSVSTCSVSRFSHRQRDPTSTMNRPPNWLEMPHDLMANILQRLDYITILNSAWKVCTTWQKVCKDPAIWKIIDIPPPNYRYDIDTLVTQAVNLSCGELIDLSIANFEFVYLLDDIVRRASKMKRLCIKNCSGIADGVISHAIKKLPQLETLYLLHTHFNAEDIEVIGLNCRHLKSFTMNRCFYGRYNDDTALAIANNMPELRYLQLIGNSMTRKGLEAIINGCPHLETLDVRQCFNLRLGGKFGKVCMERIKDLKRPHDSMKDCEFKYELDESDVDDLIMYGSEYSAVDDSSEDDVCANNQVSDVNDIPREEDYDYDYDDDYDDDIFY